MQQCKHHAKSSYLAEQVDISMNAFRLMVVAFFLLGFKPTDAYLDDVVDFTNYAVVKAVPFLSDQVEALAKLEAEQSFTLKLDFWNHPSNSTCGNTVNIGVPTDNVASLQVLLSANGIPNVISIYNVQELIDKEQEENGVHDKFYSYSSLSDFNTGKYHNFDEIIEYIKKVAHEYPEMAELKFLGETVEERPIVGIQIGLNSSNEKPILYIDAITHAREWITAATVLFIINELVTNADDVSCKDLLTAYDFFIIPVLNPDGYVYTWTTNRMWRKNRAPVGGRYDCSGVDLNRNFEIAFGGAGSSDDHCGDLYRGIKPFSEPETQAVKKYTEDNADRIKITLNLHNYFQTWTCPWDHKMELPKEYDVMVTASNIAIEALTAVHGTKYTTGTGAEVFDEFASGTAVDWQFTVLSTPYCYLIELPYKHKYGFLIPKELIIPIGEETWAGIRALANFVLK